MTAVMSPRGLEGVVVTDTTVGGVQGDRGFYHYRQHSAVDLARERPIEDVWHLLLRGRLLSSVAERQAFADEVAALRRIPAEVLPALRAVADTRPRPLDALRTALSVVAAAEGMRPVLDLDADGAAADAVRLTAVLPTLIAALFRLDQDQEPVDPDPALPFAANYLWMLFGERADADRVQALEQYLIATLDHGLNASTFTARVVASTGADLGAAVTAAVGALSGPLHGGAPSRALDLLDEIRTPDRADAVVRAKVERGERIMGFGHRVYRTRDPRSVLLREVAERLGGPRAELATRVEDVVVGVLDELKPGRQLYANVEYYAGVVLEQIGLPPQLFTPTFAASRAIGWCAHVLEQAVDNRIYRPTARYVGPDAPAPLP